MLRFFGCLLYVFKFLCRKSQGIVPKDYFAGQFYAPNFKKGEGAYCYGLVRLSEQKLS